MLGQWGFFLAAGAVPEVQSEPIRLAFHLAAEFTTAIGLIVSGAALLCGKGWGARAYSIFAGMVLYSVIVSPGYFAQRGEWAFVAMFAVLLALALVSLAPMLRVRK